MPENLFLEMLDHEGAAVIVTKRDAMSRPSGFSITSTTSGSSRWPASPARAQCAACARHGQRLPIARKASSQKPPPNRLDPEAVASAGSIRKSRKWGRAISLHEASDCGLEKQAAGMGRDIHDWRSRETYRVGDCCRHALERAHRSCDCKVVALVLSYATHRIDSKRM